ncbi:sunset domain-containing protein [Pelagimonas varians]|uniref:sunset domain-containing protein n=1 Tax=Pelagimonas varians TaxID=696760 RepID=UPI003F9523C5
MTVHRHTAQIASLGKVRPQRIVGLILPAAENADCHPATRIYHLPGTKWYSRTKINEYKGERWFCSEAEAKIAGWRRAK